jgi:mRNA-degrading endonuclease toxin of MazEF toxin-antitoxin module
MGVSARRRTRPTGRGPVDHLPLVTALICVLVTSSFHGHVAEVAVGTEEGLARDSAVNCDNVFTLPKAVLTRRRGRLGPAKLARFDHALSVTLGLA